MHNVQTQWKTRENQIFHVFPAGPLPLALISTLVLARLLNWTEIHLTGLDWIGLDWTGSIVKSPKNFSLLLIFNFITTT